MLSLFLSTSLPVLLPAATAAPVDSEVMQSELDLLRTEPGGPRIYVNLQYPDGSDGLFMIDTGADISLMGRKAAERLGLDVRKAVGTAVGLGGTTVMDGATVDHVNIGDFRLENVEFAVGIPGLSDRAGAMPLDGLLGNNIWKHFVMEIDYPADLLVLHRPEAFAPSPTAMPIGVNDDHLDVPVVLSPASRPDTTYTVVLRLDTGASHLSLCGEAARVFEDSFTEGLEPVLGLGASETLPPFMNLKKTRRIRLDRVQLADQALGTKEARWLDFDGRSTCPMGLGGLIGHQLLANHRVVIDFKRELLELTPSVRAARSVDLHARALDSMANTQETVENALFRARLQLRNGDEDGVIELLRLARQHPASRLEASIVLARLLRYEDETQEADDILLDLSLEDLSRTGEIDSLVHSLLLQSRGDEALTALASEELTGSEAMTVHVARADVHLAAGRLDDAEDSIRTAVSLSGFPDAHRFRRARIALARGDRDGALAHLRRLLHLYPMGGQFLWFYADLTDATDHATLRHDLSNEMGRLHEGDRPLDYLVATYGILGDTASKRSTLVEGLERDCADLPRGPARLNCQAWYLGLAGVRKGAALRKANRAISKTGDRPDYLDTRAMVHLARGNRKAALKDALAAARLSPGDIYMRWQAERLGRPENQVSGDTHDGS